MFKKFIESLILILIIVGCLIFVGVRVLAQADPNSYFNVSVRPVLARSALMRAAFAMHNYGDGRYDYLGPKTATIEIDIYEMQGENVSQAVLDQLSDKIKGVTGKAVTYYFDNIAIPYASATDDNYPATAFAQYVHPSTNPGALYLLVLGTNMAEPDLLGLTYQEHGIVIYNDALTNFTTGHTDVFAPYQMSTILHEFGHQLGLEHNTMAGCIMNPHADASDIMQTNPRDVVTDFCQYEKDQIKNEIL